MGQRWSIALVAIGIGLSISASPSQSATITYESMIASSDLVVHAVVRGVSRDKVPIQDFMIGDARPEAKLSILILDLEVREVLKGYHTGPDLTGVVPVGVSSIRTNYSPGEEVILSLTYWKYMRGGSFMVMNDIANFLKVGERWELVEPSESLSPDVPLATLRDIANRAEPAALFKYSAVAAVGRLESITSREERGAIVEVIRMEVLRGVKGVEAGDAITFRATRRLGNLDWQAIVPPFAVGEKWLICLARDEEGLYVLDGTNGVFRVEGETLIQADRVRVPLSVDRFVAKMIEVSSHE